MTLRYHGSKISGSQQSFLTETAICIVERLNKSMDYRLVPECNQVRECHACQFFCFLSLYIFAAPQFVEIQKFCHHGNVLTNDFSSISTEEDILITLKYFCLGYFCSESAIIAFSRKWLKII